MNSLGINSIPIYLWWTYLAYLFTDSNPDNEFIYGDSITLNLSINFTYLIYFLKYTTFIVKEFVSNKLTTIKIIIILAGHV